MSLHDILLIILLSPLVGAFIAGVFGWKIGRVGAHTVTIGSVAISTLLAAWVFYQYLFLGAEPYSATIYTWLESDGIRFEAGFLIDRLTAVMMLVVTFVSLMVHIYTIGYMAHEEGYERFFSYISLFTFSMLSLVMANNFLQLFFGWEAVGLVSYLLIGFYFKRESANQASLKAFLVNRVGDFGFLLGIALVVGYFGTLDYAQFFSKLDAHKDTVIALGDGIHMLTLMTMLLFVGAMGKSAQIPLHVWLPESMEGPTPISALIHAATMVTAGIFMVARLSPAYELAEATLTFILLIGASTALFMGLLGIVQHDIKRVVAYSTLSQLGYMVAALGVSAYAAGMFHVLTHAFFKALLFLAAGSVIIAMHHDQDIRNMGGLARRMPVTYLALLVGSLALIGFPGFSGFFSKDAILMATGEANSSMAMLAYIMLMVGVFVTAFYSFRMLFIVFHAPPSDYVRKHHIQESPLVVTLPLIMLAIPAVAFGWLFVEDMLSGKLFGDALTVLPAHNVLEQVAEAHGADPLSLLLHGLAALPTWLALSGVALAWFLYIRRPQLPAMLAKRFALAYNALRHGYGFDRFNEVVFVGGARKLGDLFSQVFDRRLIDGWIVNGTANGIGTLARKVRYAQSGYLYHYAFVMIFGLMGMLAWALW